MSPHLQTQKEVASLLTAWKHLEVLSPQTDNGKVYNYREIRNAPRAGGRDLKIGDPQWFRSGFELPWNTRSKPDDRRDKVCYQVVIGRIDYRRAVGKLLEVFQDRREEKPFGAPSYACQAVIVVDSRGMPFEDEKGKPALDTVAISVFAFAFDKVLNKNLQVLSKWRETERKAKEDLIRGLFAPAGESVGPLAFDAVERAAEWLADEFKIPRELRAKPNFLVKRQLSPYENRPSPDLINSFLLDELEHIRTELNSGAGGEAIRRYLRMNLPPDKVDLLGPDLAEVSKVLAPRKMPKARWPIPGGHSLVLLQQAAVNAAFDELKDPGLYSVNGPPGTGKTTLLKDIVAGVEFDRAQALVKFDNPETAFKGTGQLVIHGARSGSERRRYVFTASEIDPSLMGYEILVASSNNKAVENVSRELPMADTIDMDNPPDYFRSVAKRVYGNQGEPWGLVAAVLGNRGNCRDFVKTFWWPSDKPLPGMKMPDVIPRNSTD